MKKSLLIAFTSISIACFGQADPAANSKKIKPYRATIQTMDGKKLVGWMYKMDDNRLCLLPENKSSLLLVQNQSAELMSLEYYVNASKIKSITTQKKNAGLNGALIGLAVGTIAGVIMGFAEGDDHIQPYSGNYYDPFTGLFNSSIYVFGDAFAMTADEKALAYGASLGAAGALSGLLIGKLAKKKFIIGGKKETYRDLQGDLMKRLLVK